MPFPTARDSPCGSSHENVFITAQIVEVGGGVGVQGVEVMADLVGVIGRPDLRIDLPPLGRGDCHQAIIWLVGQQLDVEIETEEESGSLRRSGSARACYGAIAHGRVIRESLVKLIHALGTQVRQGVAVEADQLESGPDEVFAEVR
jgi:hypothetical protein